MKVGTENRTELILAVVLGLIAVLSVGKWLMGSPAPATTANATTANTAPARPAAANTAIATNSLDPTLRLDLLRTVEQLRYQGEGRNIFRASGEPAPTAPDPRTSKTKTPVTNPPPNVPTGPAPPPPIDIKFFGVANRPGEPAKVFLSQGDSVFVAREGDIVNRRYKVVRIMPNAVEIEDVLNNNRQSIPLTQG